MLGQSNHSKLQKSKKANEKSILYLSLIRRFKVARDPSMHWESGTTLSIKSY